MNTRKYAYWISTALVALALTGGGFMDLIHAPQMQTVMGKLGYPAYVMTILGAWKMLGAAALVVPGLPRLKEWAYAGIFFDLSGAVASHLLSEDAASNAIAPFVIGTLAMASWALRPADRTLVVIASPSSSEARRPSHAGVRAAA